MYFALAIKDKQYSSDFTLYKKQFEQKVLKNILQNSSLLLKLLWLSLSQTEKGFTKILPHNSQLKANAFPHVSAPVYIFRKTI